jgi:predicted component of type VI protein secretion system
MTDTSMLTARGTLTVSMLFCLWTFGPSGFISLSSAGTPIYTYKDDSGIQNFTTDLGSIPEQYQSSTVPLQLENSSAPPVVPAAQRPPSANVRVVTASGEHRMGDHDTRTDAIRLALEAAQREALEQVATYLESVTEIKNLDVTRDDIRTYTAGIVMVLDQKITTRLEGETVVVRADLTAQVDPDEVAQAIAALRENESAKTELAALRSETDQLRLQLDAANQALANAPSPEQVQALSQERQDLLNQIQANALVSQAWTDWVYVTPVVYPYPWIGLQQVNGLLYQAHHIYPRNRHLPIVQQVIRTQSGTVAPPPTRGAFHGSTACVLARSAAGRVAISSTASAHASRISKCCD